MHAWIRLLARLCCLAMMGALGTAVSAQTLDEAIELHTAGRVDQALRAYERIVERDIDSDPEAAGVALTNICLIQMNRSRLERARDACERAVSLLEALPDGDDLLAQGLNNRALVLESLGDLDAARQDLLRALELNRSLRDAESEAINLGNLGAVAFAAGDFGEALRYHRLGERLASEHSDQEWASRQGRIARVNLAVDLEKLGAYRRALDLLRQALQEADETDVPTIRMNLAVMYRNLGDPVRASEQLQLADEGLAGLGDGATRANVQLNLGLVYQYGLDDLARAEAAFRQALRRARAANSAGDVVRALLALADARGAGGDERQAQALYREALAGARTIGAREAEWSALAGLARIDLATGDAAAALQGVRQALDLIESTSERMDRGSDRAAFLLDQRAVLELAVEALWHLHQSDPRGGHASEAFTWAQRAKAADLREVLREHGDRVPIRSPQQIREALHGAALVEYFLTQDHAFAWVMHGQQLQWVLLGPRAQIERQVRDLHRQLEGGGAPPDALLQAIAHSLVAPVHSLLGRAPAIRIAPDGMLHYLPFGILPVAGGTETLLQRADVAYLPSGSFVVREGSPPTGSRRLLGFANPTPAGDGPHAPVGQLLTQRLGLRPLPEANAELEAAIRNTGLPAVTFRGTEATETTLREQLPGGAAVLHLATHALLDERSQRGPAILLRGDERHDGLLYADELVRLHAPVRLVVLAACSTALGGARDGRAAASLAGAFLAAGAEAVIATLWDVDDRTSRALLDQFYYELGRGRPAADALRRAQQRFLRDPRWRHRTDWAAFVLVGGDPRLKPAPFHRGVRAMLALGLVVVLAGAAAAVRARRGRP